MALEIALTIANEIRLSDGPYHIDLPASPKGFAVLMSILTARANAVTTLGTAGAPTQRMAAAMLAKLVAEYYDRTLPGWNEELDL